MKKKLLKPYQRYQIEIKTTANLLDHPHRFQVRINRIALAKLLLKELVHYRGKKEIIMSRPCVYGVFSGPLGGFAPREKLCVGCLRCTVQYPEIATILKNPDRNKLGDAYFTPEQVDTVVHEAETGRVPIKGMGYRGKFGGEGWDSMWTDMSEIVRPTRDGIHGREFISTVVDLGSKPSSLHFDQSGKTVNVLPQMVSLPIPFLFDMPPKSLSTHQEYCRILADAARQIHSLAILPIEALLSYSLNGPHLVPVVTAESASCLKKWDSSPRLIELEGWNKELYYSVQKEFPNSMLIVRAEQDSIDLTACYQAGVRLFHLTCNYHGKNSKGEFALELIKKAHKTAVDGHFREEITLIGSGGIVAAEHPPKAILCGLDAVALDTPLLIALQARLHGPCLSYQESDFVLPDNLSIEWGAQRLKNLMGSWRDQLLEILGAMGLREVRRLRGELGRALFQKELEKEAFTGIVGYEPK